MSRQDRRTDVESTWLIGKGKIDGGSGLADAPLTSKSQVCLNRFWLYPAVVTKFGLSILFPELLLLVAINLFILEAAHLRQIFSTSRLSALKL